MRDSWLDGGISLHGSGALFYLMDSQEIRWPVLPHPPLRLEAHSGIGSLDMAQRLCPWWIDGMLNLLVWIFEPEGYAAEMREIALQQMQGKRILAKWQAKQEADALIEEARRLMRRANRLLDMDRTGTR